MIKILVVDDSALMRKLLGDIFRKEPEFEVRFARDGVEALEKLQEYKPDVVTLDVHMPHMGGLACLDRIMVEHPCPVVMVSSLTTAGAEATLEALRLGAVDFVAKPGGAISLGIPEMAADLIQKVRAAAGARIRTSLRLRERIQHRIGRPGPRPRPAPAPTSGEPLGSGDRGLVLIGASTGGPPALELVLTALPHDFGWPIIVAQHMPASFTGPFARRLDSLCALSVIEVTKPMELRQGFVYVGRGDADVVVSRRAGALVVTAAPARPDYPWHPSTDRMVRTAMEQLPAARLIGVLLTGMGSDGAEAMTLLHAEGGRTIAEAAETAVVWGMPGELAKADGADWILPLPAIAKRLRRLLV